MGYRLVFSGRTIYNEIDIAQNSDLVGVGTIAGCKARFSKDIFQQDFLVTVIQTAEGWHLVCEVGVYLMTGSGRAKEADVAQGDLIPVYSGQNEQELFKISCFTNYEDVPKTFDHYLEFQGKKTVTVGSLEDSELRLLDVARKENLFKLDYEDDGFRITTAGSTLGIYVNGSRAVGRMKLRDHDFVTCGPYVFHFANNRVYVSGGERIKAAKADLLPVAESRSALPYPKFNRNTRIKNVIPTESIEILDPPAVPTKPTDNLFMMLFPAAVTLILVIVLRGVMSSTGGMYVIFSVCTMSLGIVTSVINYRKSKKDYANAVADRQDTYQAYVSNKEIKIKEARKDELTILKDIYPSASVTLQWVEDFSGNLFDRNLSDDDFLHVTLGEGKCEANRKINYKARESLTVGDELQQMPEELAEKYKYHEKAPVVIDLKEAGIIGIVGEDEETNKLLKVIVEDLCVRQYADDAKMYAVCNKEWEQQNDWLRFLPHFQSADGLARNVICDKESGELQFEYLYKTLTIREGLSKNGKYAAIIVFVLDPMGLYVHPISKYLEKAKDLGVYFIFLVNHREELPQYCGRIIEMEKGKEPLLINASDYAKRMSFTYPEITDEQMRNMAIKLAPVYCEEVSVEGNLPKSFSLFSLLGIQGTDDLDLRSRWQSMDVTKTMAAPLGIKSGDEVIYLDLHERAHGPHGLVAGTTGSGKSEILQTYILSMATLYSPLEVGFVIIDFKGGGMAKQFADLPHLMGAITDIDGNGVNDKTINRSLMSIKAEIDKRKRLFAEEKVNNIGDYIKAFKARGGDGMTPLPHLILIIDEFAELKTDQPDFMKEVISAARVGRSLGIHLILATQRPNGIIDGQIWSNSRFKLCLKVQSASDSNEVLKSPLAAEIREPGRAYLQVGNNEIFELFQSAYSGGPAQSEEMDHVTPFKLFEVDACGRRKMIFEKKAPKLEVDVVDDEKNDKNAVKSQLRAITMKVAQYCKDEGINRLPSICQPPLPTVMEYPENGAFKKDADDVSATAGLGYLDDPATQSQSLVELDLSANNVLIIGSSMSGKTNLIMTMIRSLAERYTPKEVSMYVLDFGPSILSNFRYLPHVGGVVNESDDEMLKNLFKLLNAEILERKQKFMEAKVSSLMAYKESGHTDLPWIILFVDNFVALKELYLANEDQLLPICRNGLSVGISVVIANQNLQGFGYKYVSSFSKRIALHCNDTADYNLAIEHARLYPDNYPGRAILEIEKTVYEMQTFSSFSGKKEKERVEKQYEFMNKIEEQSAGAIAKVIPMIPPTLSFSELYDKRLTQPLHSHEVAIGLDYRDISVVSVDFAMTNELALIGKASDNSRAFLKNVFSRIGASGSENKTNVYLVDSRMQELAPYQKQKYVKFYATEEGTFAALIEQLHSEVVNRSAEYASQGPDYLETVPLLLVVVSGSMHVETACKDSKIVGKYKEIMNRYSDMKISFLYVNLDNAPGNAFSGPEIVRRLVDSKSILTFEDPSKLKFITINQREQDAMGKKQPGDGIIYRFGEPTRFKVALP